MEMIDGLPPSVSGIAEFLADAAMGYDNHLKWNEQAMFKADLMNTRVRWAGVDARAFSAKCLREGMRPEDVNELTGWLNRAQAGRRLVPERSYRDHRFPAPTAEELLLTAPMAAPVRTSRIW